MLLDAIDLGATFVFAISGATQGVRHRLDLFGVLVVAWAADDGAEQQAARRATC